jgi:hypothetical protein
MKEAHVISEQEQLKNWIAMTDYYRAKREYEPWCMKMNSCTTKCEDCPDEPVQEKSQYKICAKRLESKPHDGGVDMSPVRWICQHCWLLRK